MSDDFIDMNHAELMRQLADFDRKLAKMDEKVSNEIAEKVIKEAANMLHSEQKRLLSAAPTEGIRRLADDLSVWRDNSRPAPRKVSYRAGYSDDKINKSIKYFVIEYGRPGKKHKEKDKKGRKIGRIQPYSHIRAAWFISKDTINKFIAERLGEEMLQHWKG